MVHAGETQECAHEAVERIRVLEEEMVALRDSHDKAMADAAAAAQQAQALAQDQSNALAAEKQCLINELQQKLTRAEVHQFNALACAVFGCRPLLGEPAKQFQRHHGSEGATRNRCMLCISSQPHQPVYLIV